MISLFRSWTSTSTTSSSRARQPQDPHTCLLIRVSIRLSEEKDEA
jgi:hypothetical protein